MLFRRDSFFLPAGDFFVLAIELPTVWVFGLFGPAFFLILIVIVLPIFRGSSSFAVVVAPSTSLWKKKCILKGPK
jgi:hypothetical protein